MFRRWMMVPGVAILAALIEFGLILAGGSGIASAAGPKPHFSPGPPHYKFVGKRPGRGGTGTAPTSPEGTTFACQTSSPPTCFSPAQIRTAYGIDQLGLDGTGETIVIVDAFGSPTITSDLTGFDQTFGLPDPPSFNVLNPDGAAFDSSNPNDVLWAGETSLDVEWAHAIAPGAKIDLVLAKSNADPDIESALQYAVANHLGQVLSMSFGEAEACEATATFNAMHDTFQTATDANTTLLASSGDWGAADPTCDGTSFMKATSTPASDPLVTGVGGTSLVTDTSGDYQSESVWNDFSGASGGGFSSVYPAPSYQSALALSSRGVPDVAYDAAISSGVLVVWSSSGQGSNLVFEFSGTSAGAPQWAGLVALADQLHGQPLGPINSKLYKIAAAPAEYAQDFHDITVGDNNFRSVTGYSATTGWDPATGLGSPRANALIPQLAIIPTTLTAAPAKRGILSITFSAKLSRTDNGAAISGQTIVFSIRGRKACQATTNTAGVASCKITGLATITLGTATYTASYAGSGEYQSSSGTGTL